MRTLVISICLLVLGISGYTQNEVRSNISFDLCSCFERINPEIGDAQYERALRNCLENALLNNPSELDKMVKLRAGTSNKGFSIGQWLGDLLENNCPSFKKVKERMRKMEFKLTYNDHGNVKNRS